jgi:signal transduction histidine kinase
MNLNNVWREIDKINIEQTGRAFITSREGVIIAHQDKRYIGTTLLPALQPILAGYTGQIEYIEPFSKQSMLATFSPISKQSQWGIIFEQQKSESFAPFTIIMLISFCIMIVIIVLILFFSIIIAHDITSPIEYLTKKAKLIISTNNLNQEIIVNRQDEIGQLAMILNQMINNLQQLDQLKDNFLSVTTHELKTPLIPIKSQAQLLIAGDYGSLNQQQKKAVIMILRNEENLNKLSGEILDIAKIKSKKFQLILAKNALDKIIIDAVDDSKKLAKERQITISLLPFPKMLIVMVDKLRITQVLNNLLNNAIKFTPKKGKIEIEVKKSGQEIIVKIQDSGIGISSKNLNKLFVPFFQIDSDLNRQYRGTGLGLAISKGIIETHGGKIWADSQGEGKGTTFGFSLPIK